MAQADPDDDQDQETKTCDNGRTCHAMWHGQLAGITRLSQCHEGPESCWQAERMSASTLVAPG